jgi:DNA-binding PadR family transcriptional regulator
LVYIHSGKERGRFSLKQSSGLKDSEETVLAYVMENGPVHGYLIQKSSDISNKTTYVSLKSLKEKKLLTEVAVQNQNRPGQPMKVYQLTLRGLCVGGGLADIFKKVDLVVEKWKNLLPFIFKRWKVFKEFGLADKVKLALKSSLELCALDWKFGHQCDDEVDRKTIEKRFLNYFVMNPQPPEVMMRWNRVVHSDEELTELLEEYHMKQRKIHQAFDKQHKTKLQILNELKKANPSWKEIKKLETAAQRPFLIIKETWE